MFLTDLGSLELYYRAVAWNRHVHVVLPLPVCVGHLTHPQAQGKQPLRKDLQEALFPQAWKWSLQDVEKASILQGKRGSQPVNVCEPVFGRNRLAFPTGELQFCSEDRNSRVRTEHLPCLL